ncbi:ras and EF-hand domain-containing protein isoform X2 [Pungitius pungitius]|uniref:ras and EF-hand domain-containing protein isoform X2 n=1 Tax=Pungitius pungitius TaxID=134920 RepID=UPI0018898782|nr:ras and EF-hand domain-containing protein isoform X2 [Pungitius pungitius]
MERPSLGRLFSACDVNKSGKIEYDDFTVVCRELNVSETEIKSLFDKFDPDEDGGIDYGRFASRFQEVSETLDFASLGAGSSRGQGNPWEDFESRIDAEAFLSQSLREQLAHLYQTIHSSANTNLLQQYEEIIHSLISQSQDNRLECEQLETSIKRAEEMNNSQLSELEEDLQQQLAKTEERVRDEERKKMEGVMAGVQRKHKNEVMDLHATVDRLLKSQEDSEFNHSKEEMETLNRRISDLSQQNEDLRTSLLQAQTDSAVLHSELDKLKNMYADQKAQHKRESDELKRMVMEYQSYSNQIQILQETNKKLYDSNDGLRSALASEAVAAKRSLSPQNEIPARRMKPLRQSTLNHGSPEQDPSKSSYSHVATWADKYLDSGVSLPMDTAESSGSDYDSDDGGASVETMHHSYSCVPSDVEISEMKPEAPEKARSKASSLASSLRRRLSAFSTKPLEADLSETTEPAPMFRLVLAGDAGAGKSSFLLRLTLNDFRGDIPTTLGVDFQIKRMLVDGEKTSLQIWDTAGQERFRSIARSYFRKAHGVLLLYDVTSESSFLNVRAWMEQIQESTEDKIPMCVIGNKVDLREQLPEGSCVSSLHGEKLAKAYGALFCETSAKEGTNVVETVLHLAREVKKSVKLRRQSGSAVRLSPSNPKKTLNACCGL